MKTPLTKSECQRLVETTQKLTEEIVALWLTVQRAHLLLTHQAKLPAGIEKTVGKKALYHDKLSARTARKWKRETIAKMRANGISNRDFALAIDVNPSSFAAYIYKASAVPVEVAKRADEFFSTIDLKTTKRATKR